MTAAQALETFTELGDRRGLAEAGWELGSALRSQGRIGEAHAVFERALLDAEASGALTQRRRVIGSISFVLCTGPMPTSGAIRRCEELRRSSSDDQTLDGVVTRNLAALYAMAGRLDDAREAIRRSSAVLDDLNIVTATWAHRWSVAEAKELLGDRAGAKEELSAAWRRFGDIGGNTPDRRAMHGAYKLALLYCDDGRWDDAERCLEYGSEVSQLPQFSGEIPLGLAARARVAARRDDAMRAAALAQAAVELVDRSDNLNLRGRVWSAFAEVERKSGSEAQADAATAEAIRLYEQKGNITAAERLRSSA
jgi:tetratricopeptide (TPR) repeat protein